MDINWPDWLCPARFDLEIRPNVQIAVSVLNKGIVTSEIPGTRFFATVVLSPFAKRDPRYRRVEALFGALRGPANRLVAGHLGHKKPFGTLSGTVTCAAASQGDQMVTLTGVGEPSHSDMLSIQTADGPQWVMVVDASVGVDGVDVVISPPLRADVAGGALVTYQYPTTKWIVAGPGVAVPFGAESNPSIAFDLIEVWN